MSHKYRMVKSEKDLDLLINYCKETGYCCFDFETTGLKYFSDHEYPLILGVSFQPGSAWIIPLGHNESPFKKNWKYIFKKFGKEVLENWDIVKIAWNFKFEYKWCIKNDITTKGRLFDGMLAKYCLDEERPHGLKDVVAQFYPEYAGYDLKMKGRQWKDIPMEELAPYCALDADLTLRLMMYFEKKLIQGNFYNLFRNLLMMGTRFLAESEYRGSLIDRDYLENLIKEYKSKIAEKESLLRNNPNVLRFEKLWRKSMIKQAINKLYDEIADIEEKDGPGDRKITFRENKIKKIQAGEFGKKEQELYDQGLNFASPKQLIQFLFKPPYGSKFGLKLDPIKFTKQKKKSKNTEHKKTPSTDEETLTKLQKFDKSGFMSTMMDLRGLTKLYSTYMVGTHKLLDENDRVHTSFKIHGTVTGRLSSEEPNLQNIPRDTTASEIKRMFIPPKSYVLLEVDYSQAELRVVAEIAQDKNMIDIFKRNHNIHVATACKMFKADYDVVKGILKDDKHPDWLKWEKQKKIAKSLNFSILYMQGDEATAETLGCSVEEAAKFKKEWFNQFPQVAKWMKKQIRLAHDQKFVMNMFGRKRRLYDIDSDVKYFVAEAERQSVNTPIQGTASDFTFFSQVVLREMILKGELPEDMIHVYTVHDSIGYYVLPEQIHKIVPVVIKICDNPQTKDYFGFELKDVYMKVSAEGGEHWAALKEYDAWTDYAKELVEFYGNR